jgi:predicted SnoaL-like aldol condensation-catalyzing enzyme
MMTKKEIALDFLVRCAAGDEQNAYDDYVSIDFIHHNPNFEGDRASLLKAMQQSSTMMPNKTFKPLRALEDDKTVAVHSFISFNGAMADHIVMHILRFEGNKIVELWDFGQAIPTEMPNKNGML